VGAQGTHACTFQPRASSLISILVNVTRPHVPTLSYFKEPFWLHQAGERQHHRSPCPRRQGTQWGRVPVPWQRHVLTPNSAHGCPAARPGDGGTGPADPAVAAAPRGTGGAAGLPGPLRRGQQPRLAGDAGLGAPQAALPTPAAGTRPAGRRAGRSRAPAAVASSSALPRRCCRSRGQPGEQSWTCGRAPATAPRCGPSPAGRGTRAAGAPGPNPSRLAPWPTRVRETGQERGPWAADGRPRVLETGRGAAGRRRAGRRRARGGLRSQRCSPPQAGSSRASRWCRCSSRERSWGCAAPSPPSTGKRGAGGRRARARRPGTPGHPGTGDTRSPRHRGWPPTPPSSHPAT